LRVHATRHQALNSISVFNPVNGRERKEREGVREKEWNCAVATLIDVAVQPTGPSRKIENCNRHGKHVMC